MGGSLSRVLFFIASFPFFYWSSWVNGGRSIREEGMAMALSRWGGVRGCIGEVGPDS